MKPTGFQHFGETQTNNHDDVYVPKDFVNSTSASNGTIVNDNFDNDASLQVTPSILTTPTDAISSPEARVGKSRSWKKPTDKPKRPLSAYNIFFQLERDRIVAGEPERLFTKDDIEKVRIVPADQMPKRRKTHGKIAFADLARKIGSKWKQLPVANKVLFEDRAKIEKARYENEVAQWNLMKKYGQYQLSASSLVTPNTAVATFKMNRFEIQDPAESFHTEERFEFFPVQEIAISRSFNDTMESVLNYNMLAGTHNFIDTSQTMRPWNNYEDEDENEYEYEPMMPRTEYDNLNPTQIPSSFNSDNQFESQYMDAPYEMDPPEHLLPMDPSPITEKAYDSAVAAYQMVQRSIAGPRRRVSLDGTDTTATAGFRDLLPNFATGRQSSSSLPQFTSPATPSVSRQAAALMRRTVSASNIRDAVVYRRRAIIQARKYAADNAAAVIRNQLRRDEMMFHSRQLRHSITGYSPCDDPNAMLFPSYLPDCNTGTSIGEEIDPTIGDKVNDDDDIYHPFSNDDYRYD